MTISFRGATMRDAAILFEWRNDGLTRSMSRVMDVVQWDGHLQWLRERLDRPGLGLYICEENGIPVGTVRIDGAEISYTVAPTARGRGIATRMLVWAREQFGELTAVIRADNVPSIHAARRAGHRVQIIDENEL